MSFWQIPWWEWLMVSIVGWAFCLLSALVTSRKRGRRKLSGSILVFGTAAVGIGGFLLFIVFSVRAIWLL